LRAVIQRVKRAAVAVCGRQISEIGVGLLVLIGVASDDTMQDVEYIANKCCHLRIFEGKDGIMNHSVQEIDGEILLVSQFTLYGDVRRGRRPSYSRAAIPEQARGLFDDCVRVFKKKFGAVKTGKFQEMMDVSLVNDGPVTILIDSKKEF
jgi:D-tyrosyl-tRNA(Tyr) deacylase